MDRKNIGFLKYVKSMSNIALAILILPLIINLLSSKGIETTVIDIENIFLKIFIISVIPTIGWYFVLKEMLSPYKDKNICFNKLISIIFLFLSVELMFLNTNTENIMTSLVISTISMLVHLLEQYINKESVMKIECK